MAKLDKSNNHEWCLLRTMVQPNAGWGALCESCMHMTSPRTNSDFPCKRWGTKHPPYPNLLRYSYPLEGVVDDVINKREVKINDVLDVDFAELCLAFVHKE